MKVRVWKMNDCEWVAARTKTEAIDCLIETTSTSRAELELEDIVPLTQAEMNRLTFVTDDAEPGQPGAYKRHSFATQLALLIERGVKFPAYFASTEY